MRRVVLGLGNPGARYQGTRHNVGQAIVEHFVAAERVTRTERENSCRWCEARPDVVLAVPQVYMNESGAAAVWLLGRFDLAPLDLLVVHDDLDLPLGRMKLKRGGGSAGHRGIDSIADDLVSPEFCRLRVGVGRPEPGTEVIDWVLAPFAEAERATLARVIDAVATGIRVWLDESFERAVGQVNGIRLEASTDAC